MNTADRLHATGRHLQKCHSHQCDLCRQHWGCDGQECKRTPRLNCPACVDPDRVRLDDGRRLKLFDRLEIRYLPSGRMLVWRGSLQLGVISRSLDRYKVAAWMLARVQGVN